MVGSGPVAKLLPEPVRSRGKSLVLFSKLFRGILVRLVMDDVMYQLEKVARLLLVKTCFFLLRRGWLVL